ncbi:MAG: UDP-N-acetylmuramoyl-tripeptide--D-alanyl-D-alanine ligase [Actinomycetota bacterium]
MIKISALKLADVLAGELIGDPSATVSSSVETDSRLVNLGSLFVAKRGEQTDGHLFVGDALQKGASVAIVERKVDEPISQVVVKDSVRALGLLAKWLLAELKISGQLRVIGITGSNGKTTTKNMLREILSKVGTTIAPIESYNNSVGAPISMLKADEQTRFLVVEMGAEGLGSIDYLAQIAKPDFAAILKIGMAHAGEFGGIEQTAIIKGELARALEAGSNLVLNSDDALVAALEKQTKATVHFFGSTKESSYWASDIELTKAGTSFVLHWPDGESSKIELKILGEHHINNALAAAAVANLAGASHREIVDALQGMELAERWRMQRMIRNDGVVIINDAYNASPDSMKAALQTLAQLGRMGSRTIAVLGEMAELGEYSVAEHDAIGRLVVRLNIDQLVVVGEGAKLIHMGASQEGSWDGESKFFPTIAEALAYLRGILTSGDTVLVKSSKSANLRFLGDELMEAVN